MRHKSVNTPLSHERLVGSLHDGGRGTHVTHFVQLYPQPLYTASQVRTTNRSWDEGVLTDVCLTGVLTDLCLILYIKLQNFFSPIFWPFSVSYKFGQHVLHIWQLVVGNLADYIHIWAWGGVVVKALRY